MPETPMPPWEKVYPNAIGTAHSQYLPLIGGPALARTRPTYENSVVDRSTTPDKLAFMLDVAGVDVSNIKEDWNNQISLDRITPDSARLRPLSYTHHVRFYKSLDARAELSADSSGQGIMTEFQTLREVLAKGGKPHEPNSDIAPCKLGISCLIVEGTRKDPRRILTTMRSPKMIYYPGAKHSSFSGGVEIEDYHAGDPSLLLCLQRAAARECREELSLDFTLEQIDVLGIWRDLERCSAQSFAFVFVDDLAVLDINRNAELTSHRIEELEPGWWDRIAQPVQRTPELDFLLAQLSP